MIAPARTSAAFVPLTLDRAQSSAHPAIQVWKGRLDAVLEVGHPAAQRPIDFLDDLLHRVGSGSLRLLADGFFELVQALLAGPSHASLEVITQKVKASSLACFHDASLGGVQA